MYSALQEATVELYDELQKLSKQNSVNALDEYMKKGWTANFFVRVEDWRVDCRHDAKIYRFQEALENLRSAAVKFPTLGPIAEKIALAQQNVGMVQSTAASRFWKAAAYFANIELEVRRHQNEEDSSQVFLAACLLGIAGRLRLTHSLGDDLRSFPPDRGATSKEDALEEIEARTKDGRCWLMPMTLSGELLAELERWYAAGETTSLVDLIGWGSSVIRTKYFPQVAPHVGENLWLRTLACAEARVALQFAADALFSIDLHEQVPKDTRYAHLAKRIQPVLGLWANRALENLMWRAEMLASVDPEVAAHIWDWQNKLVYELHEIVSLKPVQDKMDEFEKLMNSNADVKQWWDELGKLAEREARLRSQDEPDEN